MGHTAEFPLGELDKNEESSSNKARSLRPREKQAANRREHKDTRKGLERMSVPSRTPPSLPAKLSSSSEEISGQGLFRLVMVEAFFGVVGILGPALAPSVVSVWLGTGCGIVFLALAVVLGRRVARYQSISARDRLLGEAFDSTLSPQLITDGAGTIVLANRAFRGWINLEGPSAVKALEARFGVTPKGAEEFKALRARLVRGQTVTADLPVLRGSRVTEWRRIVARPLDGPDRYCHWRFEDISERRRMERAMRDEQNKLVDFMDHAPVGLYSVDQHGRFRFVNHTLATWLQVTPEEMVKGDARLRQVLGDLPTTVAPYALGPGPQGELRGEVMMRRRDSSLFPVAITQTVVVGDDGRALRTRSIVRNLAPEREWQKALSLSEYRFQRLFAESPIGVLLLDSSFVTVECNHAFERIAGRPHEAIINLPLAEIIAPAERATALDRLRDVLNGTDSPGPLVVRLVAEREVVTHVFIKRFREEPHPGESHTSPAPSSAPSESSDQATAPSSAPAAAPAPGPGLVLYVIDATEQKRLEVQFAHSQKMQAIGQLAGGVAHDFNNLLTAMIGFCDLLLQRHKPGDQSFADIMQIKQNSNRAANLVRQLLAFSRQQTLQPKVLSLADVLSELSNLLGRLIGANIRLDVVHGRDLGFVKVDQGQLEQVIINLVVNARDAMPHGGTVTIRTSNVNQTKPVLRGQDEMPPGAYVAIEVSDTGTGIPRANLQRIFEPFFSTKEPGSGTGLGLSTVYGIVRQTGGFVHVDSHIGEGSTFTIYLPTLEAGGGGAALGEPVTPEEDRTDTPAPDLTGVGTILLVEDEDAVRVFSSRALRNKGYNVFEARSGEEALHVLEQEGHKIDLTITDVVMPQMDGPTLYKHIKERWPTMKVVFVSGYTEDRLREQFSSGEPIRFLSKPFTLKVLASTVKDVLGSKR